MSENVHKLPVIPNHKDPQEIVIQCLRTSLTDGSKWAVLIEKDGSTMQFSNLESELVGSEVEAARFLEKFARAIRARLK